MRADLFHEKRDGTTRHIALEISDEGRLVMSGSDIGAAPQSLLETSDYEWWVTLEPEGCRALSALWGLEPGDARALFNALVSRYTGRFRAVDELRELLSDAGIEHGFDTWR